MKRELLPPPPGREQLDREMRVGVIGGGIAGLAASCVLAEHGAHVTVYEQQRYIGGRAGSWNDRDASVGGFAMERGFHAFFRQYYNLRALVRRVDPGLAILAPVTDYPVLSPDGSESFAGLSRRVPLNLAQLVMRTPTLRLRDLARIHLRTATAMLQFDPIATYRDYDHVSAADYLDSLRFPATARRMLFDVFARSFFNPEETMSAAELIMMFHFYFLGNPEGLVFDVARRPLSIGLWAPLASYLEDRGARFAFGEEVLEVARDGAGFAIATAERRDVVDACVLALSVPGLKRLVAASPTLDAPRLRTEVASLDVTLPFVVWRLWLDAPTAPTRLPFAGTTGAGLIDNISLFHRLEDESRAWAAVTGGSVIELHAYAVPADADDDAIRRDLLAGLHRLYPETRGARQVAERYMRGNDCPAFTVGSWALRPQVATEIDGLVLAGDFVKLAVPSALMERAAMSGMLAANHVLALRGISGAPIWSVPRRGMLRAPGRRLRWAG